MRKISKIIIGISLFGMATCAVSGMQPQHPPVNFLLTCPDEMFQYILFQFAGRSSISNYSDLLDVIKQLARLRTVHRRFRAFLTNDGIAEILRELSNFDKDKVDAEGRTPLLEASEQGQINVVDILLKAGADVNPADNEGCTPLIAASEKGYIDIINLLLQAGADVNAADNDGFTPLSVATWMNNVGVVDILLRAGADVNKADNDGVTPLHAASMLEFADIVNLLLKAGADVHKADSEGFAPIQSAFWSMQTSSWDWDAEVLDDLDYDGATE